MSDWYRSILADAEKLLSSSTQGGELIRNLEKIVLQVRQLLEPVNWLMYIDSDSDFAVSITTELRTAMDVVKNTPTSLLDGDDEEVENG